MSLACSDLDLQDALKVAAVHSLAGFNLADELITRPPYRDPTISAPVASIVGGGQRMASLGLSHVLTKGSAYELATVPLSVLHQNC